MKSEINFLRSKIKNCSSFSYQENIKGRGAEVATTKKEELNTGVFLGSFVS